MALILTDKCIKDWMMILRPEDGKSVKTWSLYKHKHHKGDCEVIIFNWIKNQSSLIQLAGFVFNGEW